MRKLISRITAGLDALPAGQRADIDQAVAAVRQHRTVMLGMPRFPAPGPLTSLTHRAARNGPEQTA